MCGRRYDKHTKVFQIVAYVKYFILVCGKLNDMTTRDRFREMVVYLLNSEPTDDSEVIDGYADSLMLGCEDVKKCDLADVVGSLPIDNIIKSLGDTKRKFAIWHDGGEWMVSLEPNAMNNCKTLVEFLKGQ